MAKIRIIIIIVLASSLLFGAASSAFPAPQGGSFDLDLAGIPTMTGSVGGSLFGSGSGSTWTATINFGEISPINTNPRVTVVIPTRMRATRSYQLRLTMTQPVIADPDAFRPSDIGFGLQNLQLLGPGTCPGRILPLFNNNPVTAMTIGANGRATYPSTIANIGNPTLIIQGPALPASGASFEAIFVVAPQYYTPGISTFTFFVSLEAGPAYTCP